MDWLDKIFAALGLTADFQRSVGPPPGSTRAWRCAMTWPPARRCEARAGGSTCLPSPARRSPTSR
eukprot:8579229-Alexandrium_andersonii.AAC.1